MKKLTYLSLLFSAMGLPLHVIGMEEVLIQKRSHYPSSSSGSIQHVESVHKKLTSTVDKAPAASTVDISSKALAGAIARDDAGALENLLTHGADATKLDNKQATLLHIASYYGSTQCLRALMNRIAHLKEATDSNGYTPHCMFRLYTERQSAL